MVEYFRGIIVNLVALALFVVLIEMVLPSGKTKKYVQLISGFLILLAIAGPVLQLLGKTGLDEVKEFQLKSSLFLDRREIEKNSRLLEEEQIKQITEVYRNKIIRSIEESIKGVKGVKEARADVIINEDYHAESYGQIKRVYLTLYLEDESRNGLISTGIGKVEVKVGEGKKAPAEVDHALRKELEDKISRLVDVDHENIVITQKGK